MNMAIKRENDVFLVINLKHVLGLTVVVSRLEPQDCGLLLMKTDIKSKKDKFFVIISSIVPGLTLVVNRPRTPNIWSIAHENGHKAQKGRVFGHESETCNWSHYRCKSPKKPKTMGNS